MLVYILFIFACIVIAFASLTEVASPDLYWHMRTGLDFFYRHLSPLIDHYSFTLNGSPIKDSTLPFDVASGLLYHAWGGLGIAVLRAVTWLLGLCVMHVVLKQKKISPLVHAFGLAMYAYSVITRLEPRPELFSVPLELLMLLLMASWRRAPSLLKAVAITAFLVVWNNMHSSSLFGFIIVGAFFAESLIEAWRTGNRALLKLTVSASALVLLSGFLRVGQHPLVAVFSFDPRWRSVIDEFLPVDYARFDMGFRVFYVFVLASLPALWMRRQYGALLLAVALAIENLQTLKILLHTIPILTPFIAESCDFYLKRFNDLGEKVAVHTTRFVIALMTAAFSLIALSAVNRPMEKLTAPMARYYPTDVTDYMKEKNMKGNVFAQYDLGGVTLFERAPDNRVYIDGRTVMLYPYDFFRQYSEATVNAKVLNAQDDKFDIKYILAYVGYQSIHPAAIASGRYGLDFVGRTASLYVKNGGRFKHLAYQFFYPDCVLDKPDRRLKDEIRLAKSQLPEDSALRIYARIIEYYQAAKDKKAMFAFYHPELHTSTPVSRLAANLAGRQKEWKARLFYLDTIPEVDRFGRDVIDRAETLCRMDHCDRAESDLDTAADRHLTEDEKFRVAALLKEVKEHNKLNFLTEKKYEKIQKYVEDYKKLKGEPKKLAVCEK